MATANPRIVSRGEWGANPVNTPASDIAVPTPDLWLHHTASTGLHGASGMRSLQSYAISTGYVDLEYSICVDTDGQLYMSRGIAKDSAATGGSTGGVPNNKRSHAICAMGNFEEQTPSDQLIDGIASAVLWLHRNGAISQARITGPHRDAPGSSTACCGQHLIARIDDINNIVASGGPPPKPPEGTVQFASEINEDGRAELFACNNDGTITHCWRNATGGGWAAWQGFDGGPFDSLAVVRNDDGRLELFAHPRDGGTVHRWQTVPNGGWSAWAKLQ